ncbi:uncharacterized protein MELLADRAFT_71057 [Melampsora larici-populina 98AG31]|uniref:Uncharacterized protein n=1 Tax=Melampsora larici-populina (strain 98AG31 / pathotype 3-4-7) TaxID=747676 RepID=F4RBK0_MELLP|nr:uncharacterized protein MELLADRAFT_71057 [Melampsora larici-populina 98AG31]EGG10117.1 hypothetical protein MELLADRAFT_71057 [Melampsora larici-populina 98AG31]
MIWQSFSKDTIERSINVPELVSKTWKCDKNFDGLLAYAIRQHVLEQREPNQYALQKDWTPLGLIYRPLIKTLRYLFNDSKKKGKYTPAFTSQAIAENISGHYKPDILPNLLPCVTSTRDYIESAKNDQIVEITFKSNINLAYIQLSHKWQRPFDG